MFLRLLGFVWLAFLSVPAHAQVVFSGFDYTFEAGEGQLQLGQSYSGTLTFVEQAPASTSLYLLLGTSIFFCLEGVCDGDPNAGEDFIPLIYAQTGNELTFNFSVPGECASGDCHLFQPGQYQYNQDLAVLLYGSPIVVIGDFSDPVAFNGSISLTGSTSIPEPSTWAMLLVGFALMGGAVRGRWRTRRHPLERSLEISG